MSQRLRQHIHELITQNGFVFFGVIDPDVMSSVDSAELARAITAGGVDVILVGGSSGADGEELGDVTRAIRAVTKLPIVCYPGSAQAVTKHADATLFLSVMNTDSAYWGVQARVLLAKQVHRAGLEVLPAAYVLMEDGGTAAWVAQARPVPRNKPYLAEMCALAGQYSGAAYCIFDSGSRSELGPPIAAIKRAARDLSIPLFVAGGLRDENDAAKTIAAGAKGIFLGGTLEQSATPEAEARRIRAAMVASVRELEPA